MPRLGCFSTSTAGTPIMTSGIGKLQRLGDVLHAEAVQIARERQHQRDLHQLGRLELERAELDPALRAERRHGPPTVIDDQQQEQRYGIGRIGERSSRQRISTSATPTRMHEADREALHLRRRPGMKLPPATEYCIAKPTQAMSVIRSTSPQLISSSLSPMDERAARGGVGAWSQCASRRRRLSAAFTG